jgi:hypothetical protein
MDMSTIRKQCYVGREHLRGLAFSRRSRCRTGFPGCRRGACVGFFSQAVSASSPTSSSRGSSPYKTRGDTRVVRRMLAGVLVVGLLVPLLAPARESITLDGRSATRVFEGIGVLSAGASSRLLVDYPEPQRSEILDYLFKPNFGAAIQHLKVEIGGDINSTCGTEPSIARSRDELTNPKPACFQRGYEWWLMKEAKKRNPSIIFDVLQWGAPGWVGNGNFYSQDNADLIVTFIKGAKKYHDIDISYCGVWNERPYEVEWIKRLRRTLNAAGLQHVKIVAADETIDAHWTIVDKMANDRELRDAIDVIGTHYVNFTSPKEAHQFGKQVWDSEDGPWNGEWCRPSLYAGPLQQIYNRNYVSGGMTKTIIWSPISSYYEIFPLPNSGLMRASQPWSGNYFVEPGIWITAHTTQFIQPGWKYLGAGGCRLLAGGGSCVGAVSADGKDFSLVLETLGAKRAQQLVFRLEGGLSASALSVWRSTQGELFARQADVSVRDGIFTLLVEPEALYSITTTSGQNKGDTVVPAAAPLPLPYVEDFGAYPAGRTPRYLSDFYGVFETAVAPDGRKCLQQVAPDAGIQWNKGAVEPVTIIGDPSWNDYELSCEVLLEPGQHAALHAALAEIKEAKTPFRGYRLKLEADGTWRLGFHDPDYQELVAGKVSLKTGRWCRMALQVGREELVILLDGKPVGRVADRRFRSGFVGIGCGYEPVRFTELSVRRMTPSRR